MIKSIIICVRPILTYLVMYNGNKVLGLLSGVLHVNILAYGVPKVFPVAKACSRYIPSIGSPVFLSRQIFGFWYWYFYY
jgi:hypothetical protein